VSVPFWAGFAIDAVLLVCIAIKSKRLLSSLRFAAYAAAFDVLALYVARGLAGAFREDVLLYAVCAAAAKAAVSCAFAAFLRKETFLRAWAYLGTLAIALCVHAVPLTGALCLSAVLICLFAAEYSVKPEKRPEEKNEEDGGALYLRAVEESYRKSRALWHDLNNHIICMKTLMESGRHGELGEYINSLSDRVAGAAFPVKSGNIVLDALIADKYQTARKGGIAVEFEEIDCRNAVGAEELCVVLGNLFDNATEENLRADKKDGRFVRVRVSSPGDAFEVRLTNPLFHELSVKNGLPVTAKPDAAHHGVGLKNVRRICEKYGGELVWTTENGMFEVTARMRVEF